MISSAQLGRFSHAIRETVEWDDLQRKDWKSQTDAVRVAASAATLAAMDGGQVVLIDIRIDLHLAHAAVTSGNPKGYFSKRWHDRMAPWAANVSRVMVYDAVTTRGMGGRGVGAARLHVHGAFFIPSGRSVAAFRRELEKVFGKPGKLGRRQMHVGKPDHQRHFTFNGARGRGAIGKMLYAISHAGATYRSLGLNDDGKRSRCAPKSRGGCNKQSKRLAKGTGSNFAGKVVLIDHKTKRLSKELFENWITQERRKRGSPKQTARRPMKASSAGVPQPASRHAAPRQHGSKRAGAPPRS